MNVPVTTASAGALVPGTHSITVVWCDVCQRPVQITEGQTHEHQILESSHAH